MGGVPVNRRHPALFGRKDKTCRFCRVLSLGGAPQSVLKVGFHRGDMNIGVVSLCGSYGRSAQSSMRFMASSSSTASTWAEAPRSSSPTHPIACRAGTRPGARILRSGKLSCQRTLTTHNDKEQQPSTTPTNGEAGVPHREPRPRPSSAECGHLYRLNTTAFAATNGATASACQARALLTAIAPAPRSARMPTVPPRIVASLPVFASPWEGAVLLRTGVTGAVGVTPAGV